MAVTLRNAPRTGHIQNGLIGAAVVAAAVAVLPIVIAIVGGVGPGPGARTAFATAPSGDYAVVSRTEGAVDVVSVVPANDPGSPREVARVRHVAGYAATGTVSPDGQRVALVVANGGSPSNPTAALVILDLASGEQKQLAGDVDLLHPPVWSPDSAALVVNRNATTVEGRAAFQVLQVAADGSGESELLRVANVLGVYPVDLDPQGRLLAVVIDGRGSTLIRQGQEITNLSPSITRDWRLSPDGQRLVFIESDTAGGLAYRGRVIDLQDGLVAQASEAAGSQNQQLGVAWQSGANRPLFGQQPGQAAPAAGLSAQALQADSGFDVPIAYSADGEALALNHWSGTSFADAGQARIELVVHGSRAELHGFARFYGWARR